MIRNSIVILCVLTLGLSCVSKASTIAYEGFDYSANVNLSGLSGGTGWYAAWNATGKTGTAGMSMTNYPEVTGVCTDARLKSGSRARVFTSKLNMATDATYYVSFLMNHDVNTYCYCGLLTGGRGGTSRCSVYMTAAGTFALNANGSTSTPITAGITDTYLFVLKIVASATSGQDQVYLKAYSGADTIDYTAEPTTWTLVSALGTIGDINTVQFHGTGATFAADEIRIGTAWDDVVKSPYLADSPTPADSGTSVAVTSKLTWAPGLSVKATGGHQLYLGTDKDDVTNATVSNPLGVYKGALDVNTFDPDLQYGKTYYWRVDEVNATTAYTGHVWSFTTVYSTLVDSFDAYGSDANLTAAWTAASGATISLQGTDANYIYDGSASLKYVYNSASTATLTLTTPADWSNDGDLKVMDIHFRGLSDNSTSGQLYITVEDSSSNKATIYYDSSSNLASTSWQVFYAELDSIASTVDLSSVQKFTIGFTDGTGTVYFDRIRLYPCRSDGSIEMDFNSDCIVDFADFATFAEKWSEQKYHQ